MRWTETFVHKGVQKIMGPDNFLDALLGRRPWTKADVMKAGLGLAESIALVGAAACSTPEAKPVTPIDPGQNGNVTPTGEVATATQENPLVHSHAPVEAINFSTILAKMNEADRKQTEAGLKALSDQIPELKDKENLSYASIILSDHGIPSDGVNTVFNPETGVSYILTRASGADGAGKLTMAGVFKPLESYFIVGDNGSIRGSRLDYEDAQGKKETLFTGYDGQTYIIDSKGNERLIPGGTMRLVGTDMQLSAGSDNPLVAAGLPTPEVMSQVPPDSEIDYYQGTVVDQAGKILFERSDSGEWRKLVEPAKPGEVGYVETVADYYGMGEAKVTVVDVSEDKTAEIEALSDLPVGTISNFRELTGSSGDTFISGFLEHTFLARKSFQSIDLGGDGTVDGQQMTMTLIYKKPDGTFGTVDVTVRGSLATKGDNSRRSLDEVYGNDTFAVGQEIRWSSIFFAEPNDHVDTESMIRSTGGVDAAFTLTGWGQEKIDRSKVQSAFNQGTLVIDSAMVMFGSTSGTGQ